MTTSTEMKTNTDWLYSRVMTYRLLSEMLQRKPSLSKLIEWRREASRISMLSPRSHSLFPELEDTSLTHIIQSAHEECNRYEQLFTRGGLIEAPKASRYIHPEQNPYAYEAALNSVYARAGITFKKMDYETDDHVGIELEFMSLLAERLAENEDNILEQTATIQAQIDFIEHYLLPWVPELCSELSKTADDMLYREWAAAVPSYLQQDLNDLREYAQMIHEAG